MARARAVLGELPDMTLKGETINQEDIRKRPVRNRLTRERWVHTHQREPTRTLGDERRLEDESLEDVHPPSLWNTNVYQRLGNHMMSSGKRYYVYVM